MAFVPMSGVSTYNSASALWLNDPTAPYANAVVIQPTSASVTYALGSAAASGFTLAAGSNPILIQLTARLFIAGSVQLQWGRYDADAD